MKKLFLLCSLFLFVGCFNKDEKPTEPSKVVVTRGSGTVWDWVKFQAHAQSGKNVKLKIAGLSSFDGGKVLVSLKNSNEETQIALIQSETDLTQVVLTYDLNLSSALKSFNRLSDNAIVLTGEGVKYRYIDIELTD